jgi:hypothetical protein
MIVAALVFAPTICGMIEASATRRPRSPCHAQLRIDHGALVVAHPARPHGVHVDRSRAPHVGIEIGVALHVDPGVELLAAQLRKGLLCDDVAREPEPGPTPLAVVLRRIDVRVDERRVERVRRLQPYGAGALGTVDRAAHHEAVLVDDLLPVAGVHRHHERELDVGIIAIGKRRVDDRHGLDRRSRQRPAAPEQVVEPGARALERVIEIPVQRDRTGSS